MTGELLSHPYSRTLKLGIWFGALTVLSLVYVQSLLNARFFAVPTSPWGLAAFCIACVGFLWFSRFHTLADEVIDNGALLVVTRGAQQERVHFHQISGVEVTSKLAIHCLSISLRAPGAFGDRISFLPVRTLQSRYAALESMAVQLTARALRSRSASAG